MALTTKYLPHAEELRYHRITAHAGDDSDDCHVYEASEEDHGPLETPVKVAFTCTSATTLSLSNPL